MADFYVNSTSASPAATPTPPYDTWAKAALKLADVDAAVSAAGDTIYVHNAHAEIDGGACGWAGTPTNPTRVICGTPAGATGIAALANTGQFTITAGSTGTGSWTGSVYVHGIVFRITGTVGSSTIVLNNSDGGVCHFNDCELNQTQAGGFFVIGLNTASGESHTTLTNCRFRFGGTAAVLRFVSRVQINGFTASAGSTPATFLFTLGQTLVDNPGIVEINGLDVSALGTGFNLLTTGVLLCTARIRNAKMPAGWTGSLTSSVGGTIVGNKYELLNYGVGDTNYKFIIDDRQGRARDETTIKRTSNPASDGTTSYSMRLDASANVAYPSTVFRSPPIIKRHAAAPGTTRKIAVQIAHDGASALTDKEVWLEVEYLGTAGFPLANFTSDVGAYLSSAAGQPASGIAWDGASGTGPNSTSTWHRLQLETPAITVEEEGYLIATVCLARPSFTIFADPQLNVTVV